MTDIEKLRIAKDKFIKAQQIIAENGTPELIAKYNLLMKQDKEDEAAEVRKKSEEIISKAFHEVGITTEELKMVFELLHEGEDNE